MNTGTPVQPRPLQYYLLLFVLSLPFWLLGAVASQLAKLIPIDLPVSALGAVCPLLAAWILVRREERCDGIKHLMKTIVDPTGIKQKIWYLPIILLMPLITLLSYGVMRLIGRPLPEPQIPFLATPVLFAVFFLFAVCEEAGWMVFAVRPMLKRWTALQTGLEVGAVWAVWHLVPYLQAHNSWTWIAGQCLFTVAARVLIVWLSNNNGQSVLPAVLFHTMINVSFALFPNWGSHYDPVIAGGIAAAMAVIVTFVWGPGTLARYRDA